MQVVITVDKKPENCKDCPYYEETLQSSEQSNTFELIEVCHITKDVNLPCPLLENSNYIKSVLQDDTFENSPVVLLYQMEEEKDER